MWRLRFDGIPPSPNDRLSHWQLAQCRKSWKTLSIHKAREAGIPSFEVVGIDVVIFRTRLGVADEDNDRARIKPIVDGLVSFGVIPDDSRRYVVYGKCDEKRGSPGVEVVLRVVQTCSRCGHRGLDVAPLYEWYLCIQCYGEMALAFLTQNEYDRVREWIDARKSNSSSSR